MTFGDIFSEINLDSSIIYVIILTNLIFLASKLGVHTLNIIWSFLHDRDIKDMSKIVIKQYCYCWKASYQYGFCHVIIESQCMSVTFVIMLLLKGKVWVWLLSYYCWMASYEYGFCHLLLLKGKLWVWLFSSCYCWKARYECGFCHLVIVVTCHQFHVFQTFLHRLLRPKKGSSPRIFI